MAGLSAANFADLILTALDGVAAGLTASHVQMHTADPGPTGATATATGVTGRQPLTWDVLAGTDPRSRSISNTPSWTATGPDTLTHISTWDAATGGNFRFSAALTASKTVAADDTLNLTSLTFSLTPIAV